MDGLEFKDLPATRAPQFCLYVAAAVAMLCGNAYNATNCGANIRQRTPLHFEGCQGAVGPWKLRWCCGAICQKKQYCLNWTIPWFS
ncbi:hypothetical protein CC78DRAFT_322095 [Lojkania enalia]|uniref:Uncharacterized protein n=1 Tax=Lojkania enalia TaxID=147567 RepID=A0A9P4K776_9PLEO|nr:hypothetical protein CC78DRAFT_322095 [Didymosphaeria enalia]